MGPPGRGLAVRTARFHKTLFGNTLAVRTMRWPVAAPFLPSTRRMHLEPEQERRRSDDPVADAPVSLADAAPALARAHGDWIACFVRPESATCHLAVSLARRAVARRGAAIRWLIVDAASAVGESGPLVPRRLPTLALYREGLEVGRLEGLRSEAAYLRWLAGALDGSP